MEREYAGVEILHALQGAHNYNGYLIELVRGAADCAEMVDFGAGVGTFAKLLRQEGFEVTCVEPDFSQGLELKREGFRVLREIGELADGSVPFLFSLNVFEHIEDDQRALIQVCRKLAPGGTLLIYVPAFRCLWSSLDKKVGHYRRYTRGSLKHLVSQPGFAVERLQYADSLGFLAALLFRLLRRDSSILTASSIGFYDRIVFPLSRIVDRLFHPFFGKNVFVICRKRSGYGKTDPDESILVTKAAN